MRLWLLLQEGARGGFDPRRLTLSTRPLTSARCFFRSSTAVFWAASTHAPEPLDRACNQYRLPACNNVGGAVADRLHDRLRFANHPTGGDAPRFERFLDREPPRPDVAFGVAKTECYFLNVNQLMP